MISWINVTFMLNIKHEEDNGVDTDLDRTAEAEQVHRTRRIYNAQEQQGQLLQTARVSAFVWQGGGVEDPVKFPVHSV